MASNASNPVTSNGDVRPQPGFPYGGLMTGPSVVHGGHANGPPGLGLPTRHAFLDEVHVNNNTWESPRREDPGGASSSSSAGAADPFQSVDSIWRHHDQGQVGWPDQLGPLVRTPRVFRDEESDWPSAVARHWNPAVGTAPRIPSGSSPSKTCPCDKRNPVIARCQECREDLCQVCVDAHQRVRVTKDHKLTRIAEPHLGLADGLGAVNGLEPNKEAAPARPSSDASAGTAPGFGAPGSALGTKDPPPSDEVFQVFKDTVEKAKTDAGVLVCKTNQKMDEIEETLISITDMWNRVEARSQKLRNAIEAVTKCQVDAIQHREQILLARLKTIRDVKVETLESQQQELNDASFSLRKVLDDLKRCGHSGSEMDWINTNRVANETLMKVQKSSFVLREDDAFDFIPPDKSLLVSLGKFGSVLGSGYAPFTVAEGDGLRRAILGRETAFQVVVQDQLGEPRTDGGELLKVTFAAPDGRPVMNKMADRLNGTYKVTWTPHVEGDHLVSITLKDLHISGSPFNIKVRSGRDYGREIRMVFEFGTEGGNDGQLCRPWGVCCTREGFIVVANRSNNRIEVYNGDGSFSHNFGTYGKGDGQFDRPASVTCDKGNRLIVADKDNHRIQIFKINGAFVTAFGEKGSRIGQFNYPWDVATNSKDEILVSDTRNHRIQLFTKDGVFLNKYGYEGANHKNFDSPRGVSFLSDDRPVVTDFNNHRLLVVNPDMSCAQYLGDEGNVDGLFNRPNGVTVDDEDYIIVADSRNDRVQIFTSSGVFVNKFGTSGTGRGQFDRPSGICISPDGNIIVVDFANNRVQVFSERPWAAPPAALGFAP